MDWRSFFRKRAVMVIKGGFYQRHIKRPMDVMLSFWALLLLGPALLLIAFLVKIKIGSPVMFKQARPGLHENIFVMYKFRTMTEEMDENGQLLPDGSRMTKFGSFLRKTSLDELPELYNILKGDMSIVGPRPQLVKDIVFMDGQQRKRSTVLPGLTGWAQVNGRNSVSWEEKLKLDLEYIDSINFLQDWKIILMTFFKVAQKNGINAEGKATAEDFGDYLLREKKISEDKYYAGLEESRRLIEKEC
jgi:undecaprenyl phosphate N,N'-diacetylbacillosamine 1-phosphate transferase